LKDERDKIQKDLLITSRLLERTKNESVALNENIGLINNRLDSRQKLVNSYLFQKKIIENNIVKTDSSINSLKHDINLYKKEYEDVLIELYKRRDKYEELAYILSSSSFNQAFQRYRLLQELNNYRKSQVIVLNRMNELLLIEKQNFLQLQDNLNESLSLLNNESEKLLNERREKEEYIKSLKGKEKQLIAEIDEKRKSQELLEKRITDIILSSKSQSKGAEIKDFEKSKGLLVWPLQESIVISTFGEHEHPVIKGLKVKNNGIDIKVADKYSVTNIFEGEVSRVIGIPGYNKAVILRHGKYLTVYANLGNVEVKVGQLLKVGDVIGEVYSGDGDNNGILHFELWNENLKLDPLLWLKD
jgi:murein DD-endopeptidase MepM/ murein hydrolase activator NlpD